MSRACLPLCGRGTTEDRGTERCLLSYFIYCPLLVTALCPIQEKRGLLRPSTSPPLRPSLSPFCLSCPLFCGGINKEDGGQSGADDVQPVFIARAAMSVRHPSSCFNLLPPSLLLHLASTYLFPSAVTDAPALLHLRVLPS